MNAAMMLFLAFSSIAGIFGLWLIIDFLLWEARGTKSAGTIEGFVKKTDKGKHLPVVSFVSDKGPEQATAQRIDQMMYLLGRPQRGVITDIIYMRTGEDEPVVLRVYGYLNLLTGTMLVIPSIIAFGYVMGRTLVVTQGMFLLAFLVIAGGGMAAMKLIQRIY
jgi:hypothetical protein